ncbi:hypothetical protein CPLU01_12995 [Colletotrichum plurivorum]|uniref:Uncharacterized protein n=1 Tax=Colletotrichum plurivorum TaxID=2175906 RepID=A0A8H6N424_9PEZI|nr:hypothetical protein CPLU01_12995 [Colletotrichum plurivorum]
MIVGSDNPLQSNRTKTQTTRIPTGTCHSSPDREPFTDDRGRGYHAIELARLLISYAATRPEPRALSHQKLNHDETTDDLGANGNACRSEAGRVPRLHVLQSSCPCWRAHVRPAEVKEMRCEMIPELHHRLQTRVAKLLELWYLPSSGALGVLPLTHVGDLELPSDSFACRAMSTRQRDAISNDVPSPSAGNIVLVSVAAMTNTQLAEAKHGGSSLVLLPAVAACVVYAATAQAPFQNASRTSTSQAGKQGAPIRKRGVGQREGERREESLDSFTANLGEASARHDWTEKWDARSNHAQPFRQGRMSQLSKASRERSSAAIGAGGGREVEGSGWLEAFAGRYRGQSTRPSALNSAALQRAAIATARTATTRAHGPRCQPHIGL